MHLVWIGFFREIPGRIADLSSLLWQFLSRNPYLLSLYFEPGSLRWNPALMTTCSVLEAFQVLHKVLLLRNREQGHMTQVGH